MTLPRRSLLAAAALAPGAALAQGWTPDRPIRFVVPFPPGGATDVWARLAAEGMQPQLGQPIVIDNRPGAGGMLGAEQVMRAAPDGYTLLFTITSLVQSPVVMRRFPYDPVNDFAPIGRLGSNANVWVVGPAVPAEVTTMEQFVAWGRGRDLSFGSWANGSTGHAFGMMMAEEAQLRMAHVAYRGETPGIQDLLGGNIHGGWHSTAAAGELIRTGRLRALASTGTRRLPSLPEVRTMREIGFSDRFAFVGFSGLLGPRTLPQPIVDRLAAAFARVAQDAEVQRRLMAMDTFPGYLPPEEFRAFIADALNRWREISDRLGLQADG
ncbi:Bug family tripartite tricarboxylate transporter substrate binding protein [Falsiroseomonas oryzae]|uniref:Bug family tripartite tricarboxylate transporter substrate binding protein n=1 Tax=Falsiroseomonas oryzae TaxID=2766473 RepID=UPI0022EB3390|nr:tripartite tricarboxylate transporter substrate binding protein [Roseomonas sp. MO-31]